MARARDKAQPLNPGMFSGRSLLTLFVEVNGLDHLSSGDLGTLALVSQEFDGVIREKVSLGGAKMLPPIASMPQDNAHN